MEAGPRLAEIVASMWFGEGKTAYQRDRILPSGNALLGVAFSAHGTFPWLGERMEDLSDRIIALADALGIFGLSLVLSLLAAWNFANFLGPRPSIAFGAGVGFSAGLLWVASSVGINYLFERRSLKLFLINGGYHTVQFTLIGLALALLPCKDCAQLPCT